jgi:hypothetical protein
MKAIIAIAAMALIFVGACQGATEKSWITGPPVTTLG